MGIWFLVLLAFIAFAFLTFVRKWHDYALLFTVAIGFAVNANIFNSGSTPVNLGGMIFAIDSILYTGFMFTVIICANEYGIRKAKILTSSTIAAILVSAVIEYFAKVSSFGYETGYLLHLSYYFFSVIGTFVGVWVMLYIFEKLEKRGTNIYINFLICVIVSSLINSAFYYGLGILVSGENMDIIATLAGSYIGKGFSCILGLVSFYISTHFWIPNDLKYKYGKNKTASENLVVNDELNIENSEVD